MLWNIQPFMKTLFRRAEKTDTRQGIQREKNVPQKERDEDQANRPKRTPLENDQADVSIESLISFLSDMVDTNSQGSQEKGFSSMAEDMTSPFEEFETPKNESKTPSPQNDRVAKAATAYQATATNIEARQYAEGEHRAPTQSDAAHAVTLEKRDKEIVLQNLEDLRELLRNGVETLNISRGGTFFDSLSEAIQFQKDRLGI